MGSKNGLCHKLEERKERGGIGICLNLENLSHHVTLIPVPLKKMSHKFLLLLHLPHPTCPSHPWFSFLSFSSTLSTL